MCGLIASIPGAYLTFQFDDYHHRVLERLARTTARSLSSSIDRISAPEIGTSDGLRQVLLNEDIPPDWRVRVFDSGGAVLWRSHAHAAYATDRPVFAAEGIANDTVIKAETPDGVMVLSTAVRSPRTGREIALDVPTASLHAEVLHAVAMAATAMVLVIATVFLLALAIGRRIEAALRSLIPPARALSRGEPVDVPLFGLSETDDIGRSLQAAARLVSRRLVACDRAARKDEKALTRKLADAEALARHKEVLFREMNHRVKNSLMSVSAMLRLQAASCRDVQLRQQLLEADQRVLIIARVHEQLYRRDVGEEGVPAPAYLRSLCDGLRSSGLAEGRSIVIAVAAEEVALTADEVMPIALLVNELVTNAFKYAFEGREQGAISVTLRDDGEGGRTLAVADDGCGVPEGFDPENSGGLGMKLVLAFAHNLGGTLEVESSAAGSRFTVRIPLAAAG